MCGDFADHLVEEFRTFEPPVAEQLSVEWRYDNRLKVRIGQLSDLPPAHFDEVLRVNLGDAMGRVPIVELLFAAPACDAVIFDAGELARRQCQLTERKVEAYIAVEFAIRGIAGISFPRAPDLPARLAIASEGRRTGRRVTWCVYRADRLRIGKH